MRNCIKSAPLTWTESYSSDVESIKHVGSKFRSTQLADINFTSWNMTETLNTTIRETIPTLCRALTLSSLTPTAQRTNSHTPVCRRSRQTTEWPNNSLPANPLPLYPLPLPPPLYRWPYSSPHAVAVRTRSTVYMVTYPALKPNQSSY